MSIRSMFFKVLLGTVLLASTPGFLSHTLAAQQSPLALGKRAMSQKNFALATKHFQQAVAQAPKSCQCRLCYGKSLCKLASTLKKGSPQQTSTYKEGVSELRKAIRLGKGSPNALEANSFLMSLPRSLTAPKTGPDTPFIALINGLAGSDRAAGEAAKPKVLEFYATWCEPCKQLKPILEKAKGEYSDRIEFLSYNVDDPGSEKIIEDYEVSPIPTLIFLDPNNQVVSYSIGYSGEAGLLQGMRKILPSS